RAARAQVQRPLGLRPFLTANSRARTKNAWPARTVTGRLRPLTVSTTRPWPTFVRVPSQRSVTLNVALGAVAALAPPTARKTPVAGSPSVRTTPLLGPRAHGAWAPAGLTSATVAGIFVAFLARLRSFAWRRAKIPARIRACCNRARRLPGA